MSNQNKRPTLHLPELFFVTDNDFVFRFDHKMSLRQMREVQRQNPHLTHSKLMSRENYHKALNKNLVKAKSIM